METFAFGALAGLVALAAGYAIKREDAKLRRYARRYRELEMEGLDELPREDPYPEEAAVRGAFLREPDGRATDADRVLREELRRAREYTMRGKGAACLR